MFVYKYDMLCTVQMFHRCHKVNNKEVKLGERIIFSIEQINKLNFPEVSQDLKDSPEMFVELNCNN